MNLTLDAEEKPNLAPLAEPQSEIERTLMERTLQEVWPRWQSLLWQKGLRPMHRKMMEVNHTLNEQVILRRLMTETMSVNEVAEEVAISPSAASRAVDRLVRDGMVARHECTHDRRQRVLSLTEQGEAFMAAIGEEFADSLHMLVTRLTPPEQDEFVRLLRRMIDEYESSEA